jgi:membrane-associated phospholipid phosphatase
VVQWQQEEEIMSATWDAGIRLILWLQHFSPALDTPFRLFTAIGEEDFFFLLLPLLYWCLDRRTGARLVVLFLLSTYLNGWAKMTAGQPRPYQIDSRVRELVDQPGNGFPSGHTQSAVVVWGYLANRYRWAWLWSLAILLMIFIPLSRLYLGVHFPVDLLGGYVIGLALLTVYMWAEPIIAAWLARLAFGGRLAVAVVLPLILMLVLPIREDSAASAGGMLLGMGVGLVLEARWVGFAVNGVWWKRLLRLAVGLAIVLSLRYGLKAAFDAVEPSLIWRAVRYAVMGLGAALAAPWAFVRLRLAERTRPAEMEAVAAGAVSSVAEAAAQATSER